MLYSTVEAPPSWPRLVVSHLSSPTPGARLHLSASTSTHCPRIELAALSLDEALRLASDQSPQLAAQRFAITAAEQATLSARQLPDPKLFFGIDNLPVTTSDAFSLTQDFMTMRKIGVTQDFPRAEKRELKGKLAERVAAREQAMLVDARAAVRRDVASAWVERYFAERMAGRGRYADRRGTAAERRHAGWPQDRQDSTRRVSGGADESPGSPGQAGRVRQTGGSREGHAGALAG